MPIYEPQMYIPADAKAEASDDKPVIKRRRKLVEREAKADAQQPSPKDYRNPPQGI